MNAGSTSSPNQVWVTSGQQLGTTSLPLVTSGVSTDATTTGINLSVSFSMPNGSQSSTTFTSASQATGSRTVTHQTGMSSSPHSPSRNLIGAAVGATGAALVGVGALVLIQIRRRRQRRAVFTLVDHSTKHTPQVCQYQHTEIDRDGAIEGCPRF
ncbi:hypothetical protein GY45DRAFT_1064865 [Cubamyces sp. BRFM 1775]|nr:hypothetical protein GY45DRAFT_1064865 [Cubamyces sp. BRFM 1775]